MPDMVEKAQANVSALRRQKGNASLSNNANDLIARTRLIPLDERNRPIQSPVMISHSNKAQTCPMGEGRDNFAYVPPERRDLPP